MSKYEWQRNTPLDTDYRVNKDTNILQTFLKRERGHYSSKGRHFDFIPTIYYTWFKVNSPRYQVIDRNPNNFDQYQSIEWKFHPNCKNGC